MTRFLWWLRKEVREHRAVLVLLALTIPLGSWLLVHLTRGQPPRPSDLRQMERMATQVNPDAAAQLTRGPYPHTWSLEEWEWLILGSVGLTLVLLAGGLLGSETRRGTAPLIARTPGAWRHAFPAKLTFLALTLGLVVVGHAFVLGRLASAYTLRTYELEMEWVEHVRVPVPVETTFLWPTGETLLGLGVLLALGAWVLAASAALPWVGVPVLAGCLIGVGTVVPTLVWTSHHPYFFRWWLGGVDTALLLTGGVALLLAVLGWFRFLPRARSLVGSGLRLLACALLVAVVGNVAAWSGVSRYRDFGADAPDLRLNDPILGIGDRFVFLNATRGDPDGVEDDWKREKEGTPNVPWKVDLSTGAWERCGGPREEWSQPGKARAQGTLVLGIPPALLFIDDWDGDVTTGTWFDARTGARLGRGFSDELPANAEELMRAAMRDGSNVRDREGRKAWIWKNRLQREGAEDVHLAPGVGWVTEVPGGWGSGGPFGIGRTRASLHKVLYFGEGSGPRLSIDADTGRVRQTPEWTEPGQFAVGWWDPRHALTVAASRKTAQTALLLEQFTLRTLSLLDVDDGSLRPLADADSGVGEAYPLAQVGNESLLVASGADGDLQFAHWTLGGAESRPATWEGAPLERLREAEAAGLHGPASRARRGDPVLLSVRQSHPDPRARRFQGGVTLAGSTMVPSTSGPEAWVLYVPSTNALRVLRPWTRTGRDDLLRVSPDGTVLAVEAGRRIVRLGPAAGQRTVLFPR